MEANSQQIQQAKARFGIVGNAPTLTEAVGRALRVAPIDLSVLVTGESGSGKEFFPQIIHAFSPRKHSKYIAVNCGAIPEGTIDSELFGHEKGAFTGAVNSRKGYFEEADGGTIFLDEVAELPLTTQARLLRVLESGEFMKVGSSVVQKTNLRVVAATNVDMERAVREGKFREDLFYRLSTVQIQVPPLRDRDSDIALLARKFAGDFAEKYHVPAISFSDDAREALLHYRWPGNVRQLKNVVDSAAPQHSYEREREVLFELILRLQNEIADLRDEISSGNPREAEKAPTTTAMVVHGMHGLHGDVGRLAFGETRHHQQFDPHQAGVDNFTHSDDAASVGDAIDVTHSVVNVEGRTLEETERETIRRSLERNGGRRKATAAELNISERTLYRKIKEFGLE